MGVPAPEKSTSAERVYEQTKLMAMTYQFRPGERINEVELARRLDVSRTPLREALNRLVSEQFLIAVPSRGFVGRLLDAKEIFDLYEFRCILEQGIIRLACERATVQELRDLEAFAGSAADHSPTEPTLAVLQRDEEFHLRIAQITHNAELLQSLRNLNSRIHFVRWIDLRRRKWSRAGHVRLAGLLRQRDGEKCAEYLGRVIRRRYEEIVEVVRSGIADIYTGTN
ncbi:MAG: GntR family transcriptional regulator [Acidisphaera sp.]|nr:GntR family transcriptional regulator [Acidisphaera sp.]